MSSFLRPFKCRNYRMFMLSLALWLTAVWIANLSFGLIAKELKGDSPFYVGMIGFGFNFPVLIFVMFGGVLADRYNRHKLMLTIVGALMIPCLAMVLMLSSGNISYWVMIAMVLLFGAILSLGNPIMNALVPNCIDDKEDIGKGVTIFNAMTRTLQFFGNAIGGILYVFIGSCLIFWADAGLILLAIFVMLTMRIKPTVRAKTEHNVMADLKEGLSTVFGYFPFAMLILLAGFAGFFAWPYIFQLPIVNAYNLHGTPVTLGFLLAIGGLGGATGAFLLTLRNRVLYLTRYMLGSLILISLSLIALSLCHEVFSASFAIFFLDLGMSCLFVATSVFFQQLVSDEKRGRAMSILVLFNFGLIPLGSLIFFGAFGQIFGAMWMFRVAGFCGFGVFLIFLLCLKRFRKQAQEKFIAAEIIQADDSLTKI